MCFLCGLGSQEYEENDNRNNDRKQKLRMDDLIPVKDILTESVCSTETENGTKINVPSDPQIGPVLEDQNEVLGKDQKGPTVRRQKWTLMHSIISWFLIHFHGD